MEKTKEKHSKKGKNKDKKSTLQPAEELSITFGSWSQRISALRRQNEAAVSAGENTPDTPKNQSVMAPTCQAQSRGNPQLTKKGQAGKGVLLPKQPETGPIYRILRRQPEDVPQQPATPEGVTAAVSTDRNTQTTAKHQQSFEAPTGRAQCRDKPRLTKEGQAEDLNNKQSVTGPRYRILKRKPEDAPQQPATPEGVPQQVATPSGATQQATELTRGPVQRKTLWAPTPPYHTPVRGYTGAVKAIELTRGPVQRKTLWTPPPPYRTPLSKYSGTVTAKEFKRGPVQQKNHWTPPPPSSTPLIEHSETVEATELKRGPVQQETLWTAPHHDTPLPAPAKPQQAGRVDACVGVEVSPHQALIYVPEPELQQLRCSETEQIKLSKEDENFAAALEPFKETEVKACDEVDEAKASPQQATIYISELELQELSNKKMEQTTDLTKKNEALAAEMEQLKETLQKNKALHQEAQLKRENEVLDLELQLLRKRASEAEALCKVQQTEEALQQQKESQRELDVCLAQQTVENTKLRDALTRTQTELECLRLQWQEERSRLLQTISDIHHTLQEKKDALETECDGLMDRIEALEERIKEKPKKPKRPTLWKRFLQLFK